MSNILYSCYELVCHREKKKKITSQLIRLIKNFPFSRLSLFWEKKNNNFNKKLNFFEIICKIYNNHKKNYFELIEFIFIYKWQMEGENWKFYNHKIKAATHILHLKKVVTLWDKLKCMSTNNMYTYTYTSIFLFKKKKKNVRKEEEKVAIQI